MQKCQIENCNYSQKYSVYCGKHKKYQVKDYYHTKSIEICSRFYDRGCTNTVDSKYCVQCSECITKTKNKRSKRKLDIEFDNIFLDDNQNTCHICRNIFDIFKVKNGRHSLKCRPCNIKDTDNYHRKRLKLI